MTTTISTTDDFIRALRENPDFHEAARRELLSDELLELPQRFTEYTLSTDKKLEVLTENVNALAVRMAELTEIVAALVRNQERMQSDMQDMRADLKGDIRALHGMYRRQHDDFQNFRGQFAESAARKKVPTITYATGEAIGKELDWDRLMSMKQRRRMVRQHPSVFSSLTAGERISFEEADLIIEALDMSTGGNICYIAVEASYTCNREDVDRARRNAKLLTACTGQNAYAVVTGIRLNDNVKDEVNGDGEDAVVWHQFEERDLGV